jgi:hypothetical protein
MNERVGAGRVWIGSRPNARGRGGEMGKESILMKECECSIWTEEAPASGSVVQVPECEVVMMRWAHFDQLPVLKGRCDR